KSSCMSKYISKDENQCYTNKELIEKINSLSENFIELRGELRETKSHIKQYNGLREEIERIDKDSEVMKEQIYTIINREEGKHSVWETLRDWGGWIFGFITLLVLLYNQII